MASNTRQRLIEAATKRFYRDGFRNVGIDQILRDVGISKTAFYKHFTCKDDLMIAALEDQDRWFQQAFLAMIGRHGGEDPKRQLYALMDVVREIMESEDFHGCIFVNAAIEFPLAHDPTHAAAVKNKQAIESIVCRIATAASAREPAALARELCLIIEGAYVTFSVTGNRKTVEIATSVAHRVIDAHLPRRKTKPLTPLKKVRPGKRATVVAVQRTAT